MPRSAVRHKVPRESIAVFAPPRCAAPLQASLRKIIPLGDRVLVKRVIAETRVRQRTTIRPDTWLLKQRQSCTHTQSAGGILLADTGKKLNEGEVSALPISEGFLLVATLSHAVARLLRSALAR